ncbi:MAG: hypothetical protein WCO65_03305 [bacterium]
MKFNVFLLVVNATDSRWETVIRQAGNNNVDDVLITNNSNTMSEFLLITPKYPILLLADEVFENELPKKQIKDLTVYTMKTNVCEIDHTTKTLPFPLTPNNLKSIFKKIGE